MMMIDKSYFVQRLNARACLIAALLLAVLGLGLSGGTAWGQVTLRLVGDDAGGVRHFLDIDRIETEGDIRRFWRVYNLPRRNEVGALSTRNRQEIDCKNNEIKDLFAVHYQGPQGSGPIIISLANKSAQFTPFTADSLDHKIFERVCMGL